jgi:curved DNA-binding protein
MVKVSLRAAAARQNEPHASKDELMAERDFYKILGVPRTASESEIRKAYRNLARKYHPDKNPGNAQAEEKFKAVSHASDVLLNKKKRELYDEFGEIGLKEGFNADAFRQYRAPGAGPHDVTDFEDILNGLRGAGGGRVGGFGGFQDFMGGENVQELFRRGNRRKANIAADVVSEISLGFVEALRGGEREIQLLIPGESTPRKLKVRIPVGVRDGGQIRLRGQGIEGGDAVLKIRVEEHEFFRREGDDLQLNLPVTVGEAYFGAKVTVPTLDGEVSLTIPKAAKSGSKLRLRGKGVPKAEGSSGDLIVTLLIRLPPAGEEVEALIKDVEKYYTGSVRAEIKF